MLIRYGSSDVCSSVLLELSNEVRGRTGVMLLEETLPFVLGSRPRFVLGGLRAGARRSVTYQVRSDVRGRFLIGPLTVRLRDPFGLVEVGRSFTSTVPVPVPPRTIADRKSVGSGQRLYERVVFGGRRLIKQKK